jgi:hypothetical protein
MSQSREGVVVVALCCNDSDNGLPTGHVSAVECDGCELTGPNWNGRGPVVRYNADRVKIGRHWYPVYHHQMWWGNWCWDAVWMPVADARLLLARLLAWGFTAESWTEGCRVLAAMPAGAAPGGPHDG